MKMLTFSKRTAKEIARDPISLFFGLAFPLIILLLLSAIQANIPVNLFEITSLAPGITVFGLSFMTLFSATLISKDRESSFLERLFTTPLSSSDFIFGYTLPIIPFSLVQSAVCYFVSFFLGFKININTLYALLFIIPISIFFISLGLLFGSLFNQKQVGGICGTLITNLTAWFSGIWFDIELIGGAFKAVANVLPFVHAVNLEKAVVLGNFSGITEDLLFVCGYSLVFTVLAVIVFLKRMNKN